MYNLIRIELIKIKKRKLILISLIISFLFGLLYPLIYKICGLSLNGENSYQIIRNFYNVFQICIFIPSAEIISSDFSSGYTDDVIGYGYKRSQYWLTKMVTVLLTHLSINIIIILSILFSSTIIFGAGNFDYNFWIKSLFLAVIYSVSIISLGSLICFVLVDITRISICFIAMSFLLQIISSFFAKFEVIKYISIMQGNLVFFPLRSEDQVNSFLIGSFVFTIVCYCIGFIHFTKTDIKKSIA